MASASGRRPTGSPGTRLVVLRGPSGSGKSTLARRLRDGWGRRGCALIGQDHLRRELLREPDDAHGLTARLVDLIARAALDAGRHVIVEGILAGRVHGPVLRRLCADHEGTTVVAYLDVPFAETVRRHALRPQAHEFTAEDMRGWYLPGDRLGVPGETVIDGTVTECAALAVLRRASGLVAGEGGAG